MLYVCSIENPTWAQMGSNWYEVFGAFLSHQKSDRLGWISATKGPEAELLKARRCLGQGWFILPGLFHLVLSKINFLAGLKLNYSSQVKMLNKFNTITSRGQIFVFVICLICELRVKHCFCCRFTWFDFWTEVFVVLFMACDPRFERALLSTTFICGFISFLEFSSRYQDR